MDHDTKSHLQVANLKLLAWQSRSSFVSNSCSVTLFQVLTNLVLKGKNRICLLENHDNQLYDHASYIFPLLESSCAV